ncbi:MAG TPA: DUF2568 domain-containing protein [Kineosporiaceae bacterium]|nr:DUF2568 domain-containing protein [Kineosporiaceae bacterium]
MTTPEPASPARTLPGGLTVVVLALRFGTELALVGGAAWAAASTRPRVVVVAVAAGILAALAVAAVWGVAIAPNSRRRLADPLRLALEIVLFLVVAGGLAAVGHLPAAVVLAVAGVVAAVGVRFVEPAERAGVPPAEADERAHVPPPEPDGQLRRPRGPGRGRRRR